MGKQGWLCGVMVGVFGFGEGAQPDGGAIGPPRGPEVPREPVEVIAAAIPVAAPLGEYGREELAGFEVLVDPAALETGKEWRRVRAALLFDLELVAKVLPEAGLESVRGTPIVVTRFTPARPDWEGSSAACLHVSEDWLVAHGFDAARAGVVEILHMDRYLLWRAEQPLMVLHELAHAYHLGLEGGYGEARIAAAYEGAMAAGLYDAVGHVLAEEGRARRGYAATNPQEYFAELTEAYFGRNDFYPHTREDLAVHDPVGLGVVEAVWGVPAEPSDPQ